VRYHAFSHSRQIVLLVLLVMPSCLSFAKDIEDQGPLHLKLNRHLPPVFPLFESTVSVTVNYPSSPELASQLASQIVNVISSVARRQIVEVSKASMQLNFLVKVVEEPKSDPDKSHSNNQSPQMHESGLSHLAVSYTLRDKSGLTLDYSTFSTAYSHNPSPENVSEIVSQFKNRVVGIDDSITIPLSESTWAQTVNSTLISGQWDEALRLARTMAPLQSPLEDSYRLYAIGLAHEGQAYGADDSNALRAELERASADYIAAITLNENEQLLMSIDRLRQSLSFVLDLRRDNNRLPLSYRLGANYRDCSFGLRDVPITTPPMLTDEGVRELGSTGLSQEQIIHVMRNADQDLRFGVSFDLEPIEATEAASQNTILPAILEEERTIDERHWVGHACPGFSYFENPIPRPSSTEPSPHFPWPPPASSTMVVLPRTFFTSVPDLRTLGDLNLLLAKVLDNGGYFERSYYVVPGGYAIVTRIEQIDQAGSPLQSPARWSRAKATPRYPTLRDWAVSLFRATEGNYRVILFVVTNIPFSQSSSRIGMDEIDTWRTNGVNTLPIDLKEAKIPKDCNITALIYDFERGPDAKVTFMTDGILDAVTQLKNTGIWAAFQSGKQH